MYSVKCPLQGFFIMDGIHLELDCCPLYRVAGCLLFRGF